MASHGHVMCHPTLGVSKNLNFQLSHNLTKFDGVTRFHETNSMMKSVLSSEIYKISDFQPKLPFYHFSEKMNFSEILQFKIPIYHLIPMKSIYLPTGHKADEQPLNKNQCCLEFQ